MKIHKIRRERCSEVQCLAVVIDVIKAFTTAAFAFHSGLKRMVLVGPIEDAFQLHANNPHYEMMGESSGLPIPGFHYNNSPTEASQNNFTGKTLILRTSSGTQGVVSCTKASHILAASFVIAEATIKRIYEIGPKEVTFIITGTKNGDEDAALADYLEARLLHKEVSAAPYLKRVLESPHGAQACLNPNYQNCSRLDLDTSLQLDRFNFALEVFREDALFVMQPHRY